ncbi:hypothetical protein IQ06DRAFT_4777 [Phaeosphaeriaceae sp. SRC1lsM3a]|nr:hypothetical protein IQ06DRAFT_4777 [Stagonospora sp. SRC1lsM3a]
MRLDPVPLVPAPRASEAPGTTAANSSHLQRFIPSRGRDRQVQETQETQERSRNCRRYNPRSGSAARTPQRCAPATPLANGTTAGSHHQAYLGLISDQARQDMTATGGVALYEANAAAATLRLFMPIHCDSSWRPLRANHRSRFPISKACRSLERPQKWMRHSSPPRPCGHASVPRYSTRRACRDYSPNAESGINCSPLC